VTICQHQYPILLGLVVDKVIHSYIYFGDFLIDTLSTIIEDYRRLPSSFCQHQYPILLGLVVDNLFHTVQQKLSTFILFHRDTILYLWEY